MIGWDFNFRNRQGGTSTTVADEGHQLQSTQYRTDKGNFTYNCLIGGASTIVHTVADRADINYIS